MPDKKNQIYESDALNWLMSEKDLLTREAASASAVSRRERLPDDRRQIVERDLVLRLIEWFKESK